MTTAVLARQIAVSQNPELCEVEEAFCVGLLIGAGVALFLMNTSGKLEEYLQKIVSDQLTIAETERVLFARTRAHVGAYLLLLWIFTNSIFATVLYRREPLAKDVLSVCETDAVNGRGALIGHSALTMRGEILERDRIQSNWRSLRELVKTDRIPTFEDLSNNSYSCGIVQ